MNKEHLHPDGRPYTKEEFVEKIKTDDEFAKKWGELGPIYGKQWRAWEYTDKGNFVNLDNLDDSELKGRGLFFKTDTVDQIANLINDLKTNPDSRRLMVSAWNVGEINSMVLPPCHYGFQVWTRELSIEDRIDLASKKYSNFDILDFGIPFRCTHEDIDKYYPVPRRAISLMFNMRSNDVPLGLPFNIASYALLLEIIGKMLNMLPDELIANLGDAHIYKNQVDGIREQLTREPHELPKLVHMKTDEFYKNMSEDLSLLSHIEAGDFVIENYKCHPSIKIPLSN